MKQLARRKVAILAALAMLIGCFYGVTPSWLVQAEESVSSVQYTQGIQHTAGVQYISPEINNQNVTFRYYAETTPAVIKVKGSFNKWAYEDLAYNEKSGFYELTKQDIPYGNYEYGFGIFDKEGKDTFIADPMNLPKNGNGSNSKFTVVDPNGPQIEEPEYQSPDIEGQTVTLNYFSVSAKKIVICSDTLPGASWDDKSSINMTYDETARLWSYTFDSLPYGNYSYKFVVDGTWELDPKNNVISGGNSAFTLENPEEEAFYRSVAMEDSGSARSITFNYLSENANKVEVETNLGGVLETFSMSKDETTHIWSSQIFNGIESKEYKYRFIVDGEPVLDTQNTKIDGTYNLINPCDYASPVSMGGGKVTFNYRSSTIKEAYVAGDFTDWQNSKVAMTYDAYTGLWSHTFDLAPNAYGYKFIVGSEWINDPSNVLMNGGNSLVCVEGLQADKLQVQLGETATLPETLNLYKWQVSGKTPVVPTYTLVKETLAGVTLENNHLTIGTDFKESKVEVKASYIDSSNNVTYSTVITVDVVSSMNTYTIHYYEPNNDYSNRGLWLWSDGVNGTLQEFNKGTYEDQLGRTWATGEYQYAYEGIGIKARALDSWDTYQDSVEHAIDLEANQESVEVWIIKGDKNIYYEEPSEIEDRTKYVVIELTKPEQDYENWTIYSWTTAEGSKHYDMDSVDGKGIVTIPVNEATENFNFVIPKRSSINEGEWIKDLSADRSIKMPLGQKVVKARVTFGQSDIEVLPYNIGYEIDYNKQQITFCYRDDTRFRVGTQEALQSVQVEINGTWYTMSYNNEKQRYEYVLSNVTDGEYTYCYKVVDELGNEKTYLDAYNTEEKDGMSVLVYKSIEVNVTGSVAPNTINYNENAVLTVAGTSKDEFTIAKCYANLSALGGKSRVEIDPELMAVTIAVSSTTSTGIKNIPLYIVDQYGKTHSGEASVTVKARKVSGNDFDWDEAIIYFMETDRFYDGNTSNNAPYPEVSDYDPNDPGKYHGGDFAGVTEKLDYLKALGVNTIWISPIVENVRHDVYNDGIDGVTYYGYHGYWASDFEKLNPHLGTIEEFQTLIDEAHARGMKIMVDIVLNHAGYGLREGDTSTKAGFPTVEDQNKFAGMFRPLEECDESSEILSNLSGLPDFATEDAEVRAKLIEWQTRWVSQYGIDSFRVDTVKHVEKTTWQQLKNSLTQIDPSFKMLGEYYGAGVENDYGYLGTGTMDSLIDFGFGSLARNFVGGQLESVEAALEVRNKAIHNGATLGQYLSSHDVDGLLSQLGNDTAKFKVAASLQITAKGQPIIYYGEELGQTGKNDYPYQTNRYDLDWSVANDENTMFTHYRKVLAARNAYSQVFAKGTREQVAGSDAAGYLFFKRTYGNQHVLVGLNLGEQQEVTFTLKDAKGKNLTDLYSGNTYKVTTKGEVTLTIPAAEDGGTVIMAYTTSSGGSSGGSDGSSNSSGGSGNSGNPDTPSKEEDKTEEVEDTETLPGFVDIEDSWAKDYINILVQKQITTGVDATHFNPRAKVTRAEFATFICRAFNLEGKMEHSQFTDVDDAAWYSKYITIMSELGLINGYEDGQFRPQREITREEMVTILVKAYYYVQKEEVSIEMKELRFVDSEAISTWAIEYVKVAYALGLIEGDSINQFNPKDTATRAEIAKVIVKLLEVSNLLESK